MPGSRNSYTRSIAVDQVGPSDIRTFPSARPKLSAKVLHQAAKQRQRAEEKIFKLKPVNPEAAQNRAGLDEFAREGLSDLDDEELGEYILNPREAAIKAMVTNCLDSE